MSNPFSRANAPLTLGPAPLDAGWTEVEPAQRAIARIEALLRTDLPVGSVSAAYDIGLRFALGILREEVHIGSELREP